MKEPLDQDEWSTLEGELRSALQQRRAAQQRLGETQAELERLLERARRLKEGRPTERLGRPDPRE
jgi:hypothetical protein